MYPDLAPMPLSASFRALNRSTCLHVLEILRRGPHSVSEIHAQFKIGTRASISQALALLLKAEMVSVRRQGRNTIYQLRSAPFKEVIRYLEGLQRDIRARSRNRSACAYLLSDSMTIMEVGCLSEDALVPPAGPRLGPTTGQD